MWPIAILSGLILGGCSLFGGRDDPGGVERGGPIVPEKCADGYCEIPGGTFQMGSDNGDWSEQPVRSITMTGFQIGRTEVSVGEYRAFVEKSAARLKEMGSGLSDFPFNKKGDSYPVVGLTFDEKRAYCHVQGGDLPTAAQLHFASRYDDQDSLDGKGIIADNGFGSQLAKAGYKNRFGVFNLLGNVWESTRDRLEQDFYTRMASQDPHNPLTDQRFQAQELSGGYFDGGRRLSRPANRGGTSPNRRSFAVGFRCARPLAQDSKK